MLEGFSFTDMTSWIPVRFHMKNHRIYDVNRETYLFSLPYIYFGLYNKYISTTCKCGMEGLYKYRTFTCIMSSRGFDHFKFMYQDLNLFPKFWYVGQLKPLCPYTNVQEYNKTQQNQKHCDLFQITFNINIKVFI